MALLAGLDWKKIRLAKDGTDRRAERSHSGQLELLRALGPDSILGKIATLERGMCAPPDRPLLSHLVMPAPAKFMRATLSCRLHGNLAAAAAKCSPPTSPSFCSRPASVPVRALALIAEVGYGVPCSFADPGRFSLAHGGEDRHPFPVPLNVYDETTPAAASDSLPVLLLARLVPVSRRLS
ncbi:DUF763 domain-containing protein [Borborobacter arsenicus]|uniref:DUF763 domain-containing protein n=1 Tax=Borborobacter arsenicus TaxID=1851146 RepID=UPI00140433FF